MLRNLFGKKTSRDERVVHVGAFGKHPGWNDHIDDLGLDTERLIGAKRVVYVEGVGANIDSGAWDKLAEDQRLEGFAHIFLWRVGGDVLLGRLWSSRDGKGRQKYPMVVVLHSRGLPVRWALDVGLPALERVQQRCVETESAAQVREIMDGARAELRESATTVGAGAPELIIQKKVLGRLAGHPAMTAGPDGVARILYQIEREMGAYVPGTGGKSRTLDLRPQQIRVPACGSNAGDTALMWLQFMYTRLDSSAPVFVLVPLERAWADALVGPIQGSQMFCMRATPKAVPLTSEIPYTLDEGFRAGVQREIAASEEAPEVKLGPASATASKRFGVDL